jgi:hypothetical protein
MNRQTEYQSFTPDFRPFGQQIPERLADFGFKAPKPVIPGQNQWISGSKGKPASFIFVV